MSWERRYYDYRFASVWWMLLALLMVGGVWWRWLDCRRYGDRQLDQRVQRLLWDYERDLNALQTKVEERLLIADGFAASLRALIQRAQPPPEYSEAQLVERMKRRR